MKNVKLIITLGILVAVVPFLGFPSSWKQWIFAFLGASITAVAYRQLVALRPNTHEFEAEPEADDKAREVDETESTETETPISAYEEVFDSNESDPMLDTNDDEETTHEEDTRA